MRAIEEEIFLPLDGKLPEAFREAFGRRTRVIVLLPEAAEAENPEAENPEQDNSQQLMAFSGTIDWPIEDPMAWQRQQRQEWNRA